MEVTLNIEGPYETRTERLLEELSVGRTALSDIALDDPGLSRKNTTFFVDGGCVFVADENSLNGTFLNGERVSGPPRQVRNGDRIKIGSSTTVTVQIEEPGKTGIAEVPAASSPAPLPASPSEAFTAPNQPEAEREYTMWLLAGAGLLTFLILLFGGIALYLVSADGDPTGRTPERPVTQVPSASTIPVRVVDPLGGEDEDDLDDLIASWEVAEEEIKAEDVADVTVDPESADDAELNVTSAFLADRQRKALEDRPGEKGIRPAGLAVPKELFGDGVVKQKAKLRLMNLAGYAQPMDFAELAEKRLSRLLVEMPMAAESFYLDVGGSAQDKPFSSFSFKDGVAEILPGTPKYETLSKLAGNWSGQKYDINDPAHRRQMRMRLLRMFNPRAKPILKELAGAYFKEFGRPLRVTSLTRSMDYQILLNSNNPNSFKVRGEGSLPPHTSGCAFDLARKHMPAEEQNFVMAKLAEMERDGKLDALIEYGTNACFHVFIYDDGNPPAL